MANGYGDIGEMRSSTFRSVSAKRTVGFLNIGNISIKPEEPNCKFFLPENGQWDVKIVPPSPQF